jgi:hypothetical protein
MKRIILASASALLALTANAAAPTGGAPVTVQNIPLPVNIVQSPADAQQSPIGVVIAQEKFISLNEFSAASTLGAIECAAMVSDGEGGIKCLDGYGPRLLASPMIVRMVTFMPEPFSESPALDFEGLRCHANAHISVDNAESSTRLAAISWSPRNAVTSHVHLPVPVILPPGSNLRGKVQVVAENGPVEQGCRVSVLFWSSYR